MHSPPMRPEPSPVSLPPLMSSGTSSGISKQSRSTAALLGPPRPVLHPRSFAQTSLPPFAPLPAPSDLSEQWSTAGERIPKGCIRVLLRAARGLHPSAAAPASPGKSKGVTGLDAWPCFGPEAVSGGLAGGVAPWKGPLPITPSAPSAARQNALCDGSPAAPPQEAPLPIPPPAQSTVQQKGLLWCPLCDRDAAPSQKGSVTGAAWSRNGAVTLTSSSSPSSPSTFHPKCASMPGFKCPPPLRSVSPTAPAEGEVSPLREQYPFVRPAPTCLGSPKPRDPLPSPSRCEDGPLGIPSMGLLCFAFAPQKRGFYAKEGLLRERGGPTPVRALRRGAQDGVRGLPRRRLGGVGAEGAAGKDRGESGEIVASPAQGR